MPPCAPGINHHARPVPAIAAIGSRARIECAKGPSACFLGVPPEIPPFWERGNVIRLSRQLLARTHLAKGQVQWWRAGDRPRDDAGRQPNVPAAAHADRTWHGTTCEGHRAVVAESGARDLPEPGRTGCRSVSVNALTMRRWRPRHGCSSGRNSISIGLTGYRSGAMPELERPGTTKPTFRAVRS